MSERKPSEPTPADFKETSKVSDDARIADESAAYPRAIEAKKGKGEASSDTADE
jgi:hypothetical protein